jgi:predicted metalloprotease with PDZ domain
MIEYHITGNNPNRHFINIEVLAKANGRDSMIFMLPAWRPGRYELANYAQNIQSWKAYGESGKELPAKKLTKDSWEVNTTGVNEVNVKYNFYAYQLDAGASYFDEHQLYVNPVNCLLYLQEHIDEACKLRLSLPGHYKIASALKFDEKCEATVVNYHQLADSPFIASSELQYRDYTVGEYKFHIWIKGLARPDWIRIIGDFTRFSDIQIKMFGELPVKEYHFLFQMPNIKFYHGVEHLDSTVICLGPAFKLMDKELYAEFLGISSHELFHSWNIKSIRPVELLPYDYSKENYSSLGYVAEGVTTYYGDLMLLRSGVFNFEAFANEMGKFLQRHFHSFGRLYQTLAESSFDTWLDGYKPGVPDRKVSMYVKGMLVAFMMDISLRKDTANKYTLDDIIKELYHDFAKKNKGYSEADYLKLVSDKAGRSYREFFERFVWGLEPLEEELSKALDYVGCELITLDNPDVSESRFGLRTKDEQIKCLVLQVAPGSPADIATLSINDEIIAVNGLHCDGSNLDALLNFFDNDVIHLTLFRAKNLLHLDLISTQERFFPYYFLHKQKDATQGQKANYMGWAGAGF